MAGPYTCTFWVGVISEEDVLRSHLTFVGKKSTPDHSGVWWGGDDVFSPSQDPQLCLFEPHKKQGHNRGGTGPLCPVVY